ncbi:MAG: copper resistance system multicopper oxidase [Proteobacteria bacterium]|nr:copper resistance system multicopper oxidase [Pseudomonadota bacterium]
MRRVSRREFVSRALQIGGLAFTLPLPDWALGQVPQQNDRGSRNRYDLQIGETTVKFGGREGVATGINGTVPGPLVRLKEGQRAILNVSNALEENTSIHWHGLILPTDMDGVPGLSFDGISPGATYHYDFKVRQNGTYWYHSHSGLQEQTGVYGPLIIDPADEDPVAYDREFVVMLSDWTFADPWSLLSNLKSADDYYNQNRWTAKDFRRVAKERGFGEAAADDAMWAAMRMSRTDIADVSAATYTYLLNGRDAAQNWTGVFKPGERVRLRFINGSAMTYFNVRLPGLAMSVVQADGQNIEPFEVDEFQIGVAETYDVIVTPEDRAYTLMAESMDRSGYVRGTLTSQPGLTAEVPALREPPLLTMADMGMDHGSMAGHGHKMKPIEHNHRKGPGVANLVEMPMGRLKHPGIGLENMGHRVLRYSDLKSLDKNQDSRQPERTLEIHLTGNMHRYMWSFDGLKFSEVKAPIQFQYGERLRLILVNDTMMAHPIHLHGMFVELVNGNGSRNPRKHTVTVKPAERLMVDITASEPGLWAFHCHLLLHMTAGMMRAVRVSEPESHA